MVCLLGFTTVWLHEFLKTEVNTGHNVGRLFLFSAKVGLITKFVIFIPKILLQNQIKTETILNESSTQNIQNSIWFINHNFVSYIRTWTSVVWVGKLQSVHLKGTVVQFSVLSKLQSYSILEIKPCGLGSRIRDMEAETYNWSHFLVNLW